MNKPILLVYTWAGFGFFSLNGLMCKPIKGLRADGGCCQTYKSNLEAEVAACKAELSSQSAELQKGEGSKGEAQGKLMELHTSMEEKQKEWEGAARNLQLLQQIVQSENEALIRCGCKSLLGCAHGNHIILS